MKKFMITVMVMVTMLFAGTVVANAECYDENTRPTGLINPEGFAAMCDKYGEESDVDFEEGVTFCQSINIQVVCSGDGEWLVMMEIEDEFGDTDYASVGVFDHKPTASEFMNVYTNRVTEDELEDIIEAF